MLYIYIIIIEKFNSMLQNKNKYIFSPMNVSINLKKQSRYEITNYFKVLFFILLL